MTKYTVGLLGILLFCTQASAQYVVETHRVVHKPHKHRTVTRTVAPVHYGYADFAPVKQTYRYSAPGVKVRSNVSKRGEVRVREVYQQPWGGKQTYTYKSSPVKARQSHRTVSPVFYLYGN